MISCKNKTLQWLQEAGVPVLVMLLAPRALHAQSGDSSGAGENVTSSLTNPLEFETITGFLIGIIEIILIFALPIVVLFIIYAGFLYVAAQGDETKLTTARSALTWAIVGGVIVLGALQIVALIEGTIKAL